MDLGEIVGGLAGGANPISAVATLGGKIIDRLWPDPETAARAKAALAQLEQSGQLAEMATAAGLDAGQIEVNKVEAANSNLFVSGWRPGLGWVCVVALGVYFIPRFVIGMVFWCRLAWTAEGALPALPEMGVADVIGLTATLLGASTIRMMERKWGVARVG